MQKRRLKLPAAVLERAKSTLLAAKRPALQEGPKAKRATPREKIVAALKKLHPMD